MSNSREETRLARRAAATPYLSSITDPLPRCMAEIASRLLCVRSAHPWLKSARVPRGFIGVQQLLHVFQFFFQPRPPPREADHINNHDQPRSRKAVKHEGEISSVHRFRSSLSCVRQPPQ